MTKPAVSDSRLLFTGERFVPEKEGNILLEHLHRYQVAAELVSGKDVLDIASGEGFGSALMADQARRVTGVDIDAKSVKHAQNRYGNDKLSFLAGDTAEIPIEDNSFDVVVSFETIEHHDRHDEMMSEIKRVLRPDGVLIISSPDKKTYSDIPGTTNEFHVKELYRDEFVDLLRESFSHVSIYGQKVAWGSLILNETDETGSASRYNGFTDSYNGVPDPVYLIAVASNSKPSQLPAGGLLEQDVLEADPVRAQLSAVVHQEHLKLGEERALVVRDRDTLLQKNDALLQENSAILELLWNIKKSVWFKIGKPIHGLKISHSMISQEASVVQPAPVEKVSNAETNVEDLTHEPINLLFPIGHFYSPIADPEDITQRAETIFARQNENVGIDFREKAQLELLTLLKPYVNGIDYPMDRPHDDETTYFYSNDQFPVLDAEFLYAAVQYFKPKRMIEIGSGFSSLITADVNRRLMNGTIDFTCIEPFPRQFLLDGVEGISHLEVSKVEDLPLSYFEALHENDILFIDSSHVSKVGSDVNYLFFEIIPRLKPGVIVHVHDIFLPDEYPRNWVIDENRNWNEQYLLRAFLQFNSEWSVLWAAHLMGTRFRKDVQATFPRYPHRGGGGSFWMQRNL